MAGKWSMKTAAIAGALLGAIYIGAFGSDPRPVDAIGWAGLLSGGAVGGVLIFCLTALIRNRFAA